MVEWRGDWINRCFKDGWTEGKMIEWKDVWTEVRMDGSMDGWMVGWMDGWMDG